MLRSFIVIIISNYNPLWVFAFSAKSLLVLLSLAASIQFLTFSFFRSSTTSSYHRCLGLSTGLVSIGFQSSSFLVDLAWSILWICPSHLIFCALLVSLPPTITQIYVCTTDITHNIQHLNYLKQPNSYKRRVSYEKWQRSCRI